MSVQDLYEAARRNGLSHDRALEAIADGEFRCWCGRVEDICPGGAQRFGGCPIWMETPMGRWDFSRRRDDIPVPS